MIIAACLDAGVPRLYSEDFDAYAHVNLAAAYRSRGLGMYEVLTIQRAATNVTDKQYYSTIDSNGFTESDPTGTWQSLLLGAPRQFFLSAKAKF